MERRQKLWKKLVSMLLAFAMTLTMMPTVPLAAERVELVNIAGDASVSIGGTPNSANPVTNINDGSDTTVAGLHNGAISGYKSEVAPSKQEPYNLPYIQLDFSESKQNIKKLVISTLKADTVEQDGLYQYKCTVYGKGSEEGEYEKLKNEMTLKRAAQQEDCKITLDLSDAPKTLQSLVVTLDVAEGASDSWPILTEIEIYQERTVDASVRDVAGECKVTVPSSQDDAHSGDKMIDGSASTLWIANGADYWGSRVELELPANNTKCVKKVEVVLEKNTQYPNRNMQVSLSYAMNGILTDWISAQGSTKQVKNNDGYTYEFEDPQAMSHLGITLDNPKDGEAAGAFWPCIAEVHIWVDEDAEEEVELQNIADIQGGVAKSVTLAQSVNTEANQKAVTDGDFETSAPLQTVASGESFVEVSFGVEQKMRQFVIAMKKDDKEATYNYTITGKKRRGQAYETIATGTVGTSADSYEQKIVVAELEDLNAKEVEYESVKVAFAAASGTSAIPNLAEFQILANKNSIAEEDSDNIVWGTDALHSNYNQDTLSRVVDGNTGNTWVAEQYPAYVDIDLEGMYDLSKIIVYTPSNGYSQYSLYYSSDGHNYKKLAEKTSKDSCGAEGESYDAAGAEASHVRIVMEYNSENSTAVLNEIRVLGAYKGEARDAAFTAPVAYEDSEYDVQITEKDTIEEVQGIIRRNVGDAYVDWFTFSLGEEKQYDYFELEDDGGKVKITGNDGVSLAMGLNHYLKYFCNVCIAQTSQQVKMPAAVVPVGEKIHKECKVPVRYAYNYCTMSYTMAFWGEKEWRRELDWLALNGVNVVLDVTAQEEVWRQFLSALGYDHTSIKDYIAGPAYYGWAYMDNLSGFGGPVHDSWFAKRTELARKNQLSMRKLGMQPVLQGYCGMVPVDVVSKASGEYALSAGDVIAQPKWNAFQRPYMLRTTSEAFTKYAELFYECQKNVYGDITDYYATDPFHEGGNAGGMNVSDIGRLVIENLLKFDEDGVWIIQGWQGNPSAGLVSGISSNKEHALILDLYAEKTPHWNDEGYSGGKEFQNTPWAYCMLNNFGGRMGLHGHMDNIVSGVVDAANNAQSMKGIGITPEGSQNTPVLYDLLFETVWCDDASQALEEIDTADWLKKYAARRYGAESEHAYQAMLILEDTVYKAEKNMRGQGAPESYINARPSTSITAASTWGNAVLGYDMEELERAAKLLLEDYDKLKDSDGYLYDLADILKQILSNSSQKYHAVMVSALAERDLDAFTAASDHFLALIDEVEKVLGARKEFLLGTWVEAAKALAEGTDDFTKDLYEFNAKALVTTWGAYPQAISGGLEDYSNRQWAGLTKDFYKARWQMWIDYQKALLAGEDTDALPDMSSNKDRFEFEWEWVRENTEYATEASGADLKELGAEILEKYNSNIRIPAMDNTYDYPAEKTTASAGSVNNDGETSQVSNVLDGNDNTIWHTSWTANDEAMSSYENHWLLLELEETTKIDGLRYLPRQDGVNGRITGYEIWVSETGADDSYKKVAEGNWADTANWKKASFAPVMARFVKLATTDSRSDDGKKYSSAAEVRVTRFIAVERISLEISERYLNIGDTAQITATVIPEIATDQRLSWSSDNEKAVTVDENGLVTAVSAGRAVIRAEAQDGSGASAELTINVRTVEEANAVRELQSAVEAAGSKKETDYASDVWQAYQKALNAAKAVLEDPNAAPDQIREALQSLKAAESALRPVQNNPGTPGTPGTSGTPGTTLPKVGYEHRDKKLVYRVTASSDKAKTVCVVKPIKKTNKKLTVPGTIKIGGYVYKVTEIGPNAFAKNKKLTQVTIGANVAKIGKKAFFGCAKLKKVMIKSKTLKTIGGKAFAKISSKVRIRVPKKQLKALKKKFKKAKTIRSAKITK